MRGILTAGAVSLVLYLAAFACLLDRPLTLGALRLRIEANLASGASIRQPKLVILAGSNGPYSHRCETIAPIIGLPCVNAGVAVGVGLDYLFTRWEAVLRPGDLVYLPMEEAQYVRARAAAFLGPDAAIMLRHDRTTLLSLPLQRQATALFAGNLRAAVMSLIETALAGDGFNDPRAASTGSSNAAGDHVGHTAALAAGNRSVLAAIVPFHPTAEQIASGFGTRQIVAFLDWAKAHDVRAIGGIPTGFSDSPIRDDALAVIRSVYRDHGADFLELANHARYPRSAFFDSQDHLNETAQIGHSVVVAHALSQFRDRIPAPSL